jgi:hypothetical protein
MNTTVAPLFNVANEVKNAARCGLLGDFYYDVKTALCVKLRSGAALLAFASFFITLCSFPIIIISLKLYKRFQFVEKGGASDDNDAYDSDRFDDIDDAIEMEKSMSVLKQPGGPERVSYMNDQHDDNEY